MFHVVMAKEAIDFEAAKIRVAQILGREDLVQDPTTAKSIDNSQSFDATSLLNASADQREVQLSITRVLNNAPDGLTVAQKQLALIVVLEELAKTYPIEHQAQNTLAVTTTILMGTRALITVTGGHYADQ